MVVRFNVAITIWFLLAVFIAFSQSIQSPSVSNSKKVIVPSQITKNFPLFIKTTPKNATIKIMNIKAKFKYGMKLKPGRYDIQVSSPGYKTKRGWHTHSDDLGKFEVKLVEITEVVKVGK